MNDAQESQSSSLNHDPSAVRKRRLTSWLKRGLLLIFIVAAVGVVVLAYRPKPVTVDLAKSERGNVEVLVEEDGKTRVKDRYGLTAPIAGQLQRITLRAGDDVQPNQELARLSSIASPLLDRRSRAEAEARVAAAKDAVRQAEAARKSATAALDFAQSQLRRQRDLASKQAVSKQALERAELEVKTRKEDAASTTFGARVAAHQLDLAKVALDGGSTSAEDEPGVVLRSPVEGRVLQVQAESGGFVQPGTPLLTLGDCGALEIVVDVLTSDAVKLGSGAEARILRWGGDGKLMGHVSRIEPSAFTRVSALGVEEQRVNVIVEIDTPRDRWKALGDGYRVEAHLLADLGKDVVRVPESAVFRTAEGFATFIVEGKAAKLQHIDVGRRNASWVEVTAGLKEGQTVITHPSDRVVDGVTVAARDSEG